MSDSLIPIMDEETEEQGEITKESGLIVQKAIALKVENDEQLHFAYDLNKKIKLVEKRVNKYFDPSIKKAHETWKSNLAMKKKQSEPLKRAEKIIKSKTTLYHEEQERIRWEEERKRQEELRKQEEEYRLKEAVETGDESVLDEPIVVPVVKMEDTTKHEGVSYSKKWKARVVDFSKVPDEYKIINQVKINQIATATKGKINIPGIEVYAEKIERIKV